MKYPVLLFATAALAWGLVAQEQLPTAPSATKYPPPPPAAPATAPSTGKTAPPAQAQSTGDTKSNLPAPAPADPDPAPAAKTSTAQAAPANEPPKSNALPSSSSAAPKSDAASSDNPDEITTIRKRVDEVNVVFTVTDKRGRFVKDLTQADFRVYDDNKPADSVRSFTRETNLPLRVGLLIDASNSVRDRFKFEQEAAIEFLNQIISVRSDKAFVIGFDTTPEVTQDMTDSTEALSHGVRMLRPGGGTAMYDAIYFACRDKLMADKSTGATRRAIILLSDGEDNQSRVSREEAVEMAQRAEVIIYAISTNTSGLKLRGDKIMEHFAEETGGKAFFPFKIQDVSNAFSEISDELRSQYDVSYKPADFQPNGKYRKIEILADNKKYKVRARKGYYAPTQ